MRNQDELGRRGRVPLRRNTYDAEGGDHALHSGGGGGGGGAGGGVEGGM
jgi:hypothetical protein